MVTLLFVIVALGSFANSVEVRDNDNQLHKVSASLRRLLTGASGSSAGFEYKKDFVGEEGVVYEGMLPSWFRPTAADVDPDTVDRLDFEGMNVNGVFEKQDFVGEEGMLGAGFRPTAAEEYPDTVDRLDLVDEEGMLLEEADDVNVDAFDDFGFPGMHNGFPGMHNGFPGMPNGFPGMHDDFPGMHNDWILLRSDVECGNNENEVKLGTFADVSACAEACRNRDGCTTFIYGKGEKAGSCWDEAITESACTIWEDDQYDFYGLTAGNF